MDRFRYNSRLLFWQVQLEEIMPRIIEEKKWSASILIQHRWRSHRSKKRRVLMMSAPDDGAVRHFRDDQVG